MENLVRDVNKILTDAEDYHEMGGDFPLFGAGNLQDLLKAILKEAKTKFATVSWGIDDVTTLFDVSDKEAVDFLNQNRKYIQEAMLTAGWDAMETCGLQDGLTKVED